MKGRWLSWLFFRRRESRMARLGAICGEIVDFVVTDPHPNFVLNVIGNMIAEMKANLGESRDEQ